MSGLSPVILDLAIWYRKGHAAARGPDFRLGQVQTQQLDIGVLLAILEPAGGDCVPQLVQLGTVVGQGQGAVDAGVKALAAIADHVHRILRTDATLRARSVSLAVMNHSTPTLRSV